MLNYVADALGTVGFPAVFVYPYGVGRLAGEHR